MAPKKSTKQPKQSKIPGTERNSTIQEIETAYEAYRETRDEWMELGKRMGDLQAELDAAMEKHKLEIYDCEGGEYKVVMEDKGRKAKVKKVKSDASDPLED